MNKFYLQIILVLISATSFSQTVDILNTAGTSVNVVVGQSNYHVSESIYTNEEIGAGNFITAGTSIDHLNFSVNTLGLTTTITNFRIYMKNIAIGTTTLATGVYSTTGYTQVFTGNLIATPVGLVGVTLSTLFVRTAGTNLEVLIERMDNVLHTGYNFDCAVGNTVGGVATSTALSTRRYNNTILPVSGTTSLTASNFRPAIELIHTYSIDANVVFIGFPTVSCYTTPQTVKVYLENDGLVNINPGTASTTLHVRGANTFSGTMTNSTTIIPGGIEILNFTGVSFNNLGINADTAIVTLPGDQSVLNDSLVTTNSAATTLTGFPLVEDVETILPVFPYVEKIALGQLWTLQTGSYSNADQTTPLAPHGTGTKAFLFDSYSGVSSVGFQSRLYSNCINLASMSSSLLTFWMSHDNIFPIVLDSMYVSVSTDKGVTWTRLAGYQRPDATLLAPAWKMESLSLGAYDGQTIQISFEGVSKYGNAFLLDDITVSGILPVTLLNFDAQRRGAVNLLNWKTSQELNTSRFIIERSIDGQNFSAIGQVAANGNSNTERNYVYVDPSPVKGNNFYRLRVVDIDNFYKFSVTRLVKNTGMSEIGIAPNPVQQQVNVRLDAEKNDKGLIIITDMIGRQVYNNTISVTEGRNSFVIEAGNLLPGSYILTVQLSNEKLQSRFNKLK